MRHFKSRLSVRMCACVRAGGDSIGWEELMPCVWLIKTALDISVQRDGGEVLIHN